MKKNICIAGKNNIAVEVLKTILINYSSTHNIYAISNKSDQGIDSWQKSYKKFVLNNNVKLISLKVAEELENLTFLSLEFDRLIKTENFKSNKIFNIHFSELPKYKGMYTSAWPLLNDEEKTGVTLHYINNGIDTGEIIDQLAFQILDHWTCRDLYLNYIEHGINLVLKNLDILISKDIIPSKKQSSSKSSYYSKRSIDYTNLTIDLNQTAYNIKNQIRAFSFREYQLPKIQNKSICDSIILETYSFEKPGTILYKSEYFFDISTIDYNLRVYVDTFDELIKACKDGHIEKVKSLSTNQMVINSQTEEGWTPLIIAIYNNHHDIAKYLLDCGANPKIKNFNGTNLLMYAKESYINSHDQKCLVFILKKFKDQILENDYNNKNVLDYCNEKNQNEALKIIKSYL